MILMILFIHILLIMKAHFMIRDLRTLSQQVVTIKHPAETGCLGRIFNSHVGIKKLFLLK